MSPLWRARCVVLLSLAGSTLFICPRWLPAQSPTASVAVSGTVTDPSGAKVPRAQLQVFSAASAPLLTAATDSVGNFSLSLPPGDYRLIVRAPGFSPATVPLKAAPGAAPVRLNVPLRLAIIQQEILVPSSSPASLAAADNGSALVFQGPELQTFSPDDATFQKQVLALAGGNGKAPALFIDGFSGGRFPPKTAIAAVRINQNPYSAAYDSPGFGRVEISTRPGGDQLHGQLNVNATDSAVNARNPYLTSELPYYILNLDGNLSGRFNARTAFFLSGVYNDQQNNAALNAVTLNAGNQPTPYAQAVRDPQLTETFGLRLDRAVTATNNLTASYGFNQVTQTNGGLTPPLTLATQAFNNGTTTQTLSLADTQVYGAHIVQDSRFQYVRTRLDQNAVSAAPTLVVEGSFNGGGSPAQSLRDNQDRFEFQQALSIDRGPHYLRLGARYRLQRDADLSTANYNGQFTFPSLAALAANQPSQFSLTTGRPSATVLTGDLGAYAEDEWRVRRTVSLDLGFRLESQSAIPDHLDPAPRLGAAWALHRKQQRQTFILLRAGIGAFYSRFLPSDLLTTVRQNGILQQTYILNNPTGYPQLPDTSVLTAVQSTIYKLAPNLTSQYGWVGGASVQKFLGKYGQVTLTWLATRGVHQFITRNINAPLPGTYNPAVPGSGTRPLGGTQNIYEFDSNGIQKNQILLLNAGLRPVKGMTVVAVVNLSKNSTNANGTNSFPTNSYNLSADYGRATVDQPFQGFMNASYDAPFGISANLYFSAQAGLPFNITTGTDLNGDSIFNDRPAYATAPSAASVLYSTRYGLLDANPQPGERTVPINLGRSPSLFYVDLSLSRGFGFGPRPAAPATAPGKPAPPRPDRPYQLVFTVDAPNLLNRNNPGVPIGVLGSPLFGKSVSLNNAFTTNTAANRILFFQTSVHF